MAHDVFREAMLTVREVAVEIVNSTPDGACLFNSISLGMSGNEGMSDELRRKAIEYMGQNKDWLIEIGLEQDDLYIRKKFQKIDEYLVYMGDRKSHGDQYETMAIARLYNQKV